MKFKTIQQSIADEEHIKLFEEEVNLFLSSIAEEKIFKIEHFMPKSWQTAVIYYKD